jgi:hypothetical protein
LQKNKLPPLRSKIYLKKHLRKPYKIRVSRGRMRNIACSALF